MQQLALLWSTTSPEADDHKDSPYDSALDSASASLLTANYFLTVIKPIAHTKGIIQAMFREEFSDADNRVTTHLERLGYLKHDAEE